MVMWKAREGHMVTGHGQSSHELITDHRTPFSQRRKWHTERPLCPSHQGTSLNIQNKSGSSLFSEQMNTQHNIYAVTHDIIAYINTLDAHYYKWVHGHGPLAKRLSCHRIGWIIQDFWETCVTFFNVLPGNQDAVTPNPLTKEKSRRVYNCDG